MAVITIKPKDVIIPIDFLMKLTIPKPEPKPQEKERQNDSSNR